MRSLSELDRTGDPAICMVRGCSRKAIYRNASTSRLRKYLGSTGIQRGYCSQHRDLARESPNENRVDYWVRVGHAE